MKIITVISLEAEHDEKDEARICEQDEHEKTNNAQISAGQRLRTFETATVGYIYTSFLGIQLRVQCVRNSCSAFWNFLEFFRSTNDWICRWRTSIPTRWENVNHQSLLKLDWTFLHTGTTTVRILQHVCSIHSLLYLQSITLVQVTTIFGLDYSNRPASASYPANPFLLSLGLKGSFLQMSKPAHPSNPGLKSFLRLSLPVCLKTS